MIVPLVLFVVGVCGTAVALARPDLSDIGLVSVPITLASLGLLLLAIWRRLRRPPKFIVIDGSNVMHWKDGTPQIDALRDVVRLLTTLGYTPGVIFDANAGYLISGRYQHDGALARQLGLPEDRVFVVSKGTPADPTILDTARDLGARIVTNDRYRDWAVAHPQVREPGYLVKGGYQAGKLWLDLPGAPPMA